MSHRLSPAQLGRVARGEVTSHIIGLLRAAELSKHKLLLESVRRAAVRALPDGGNAVLEEALRTLSHVQDRGGAAVVDEVLALPQVGGWALDCLDRLDFTNDLPWEELGYAGTLAAAAAMRAGIPVELTVAVRQNRLVLPGLGTLTLPGVEDGLERVRLDAEDLAPPNGGWAPLMRVRAESGGLVLDAAVDCDDRFGNRFGVRVGPLGPADRKLWRDRIGVCWRLLVRHHPALARLLASAPITLVPLAEPSSDRPSSATSGWTFGAIASTMPADELALAVTLVHELHHLVLGAVEDIVPLIQPDSDVVCYAPWRDDPRPLGGLMHGVYAHLAMIRFWRRHRLAGPRRHRERVEDELARWRHVTWEAARTLASAPGLTEAGRLVADSMRDVLADWQNEPLDEGAAGRAAAANAAHRTRWRLAHLRPEESAIAALAQTWLNGGRPDDPQVPVRVGATGSRLHEMPQVARPEVTEALAARLRLLGVEPPMEQLAWWLGR